MEALDQYHICKLCNGSIKDAFLISANEFKFHPQCLKCCECDCNLEKLGHCIYRYNSIYCNEECKRRSSYSFCIKCEKRFESLQELVVYSNGLCFHANCFTCDTCNKLISSGQAFTVNETKNGVFCSKHAKNSNHKCTFNEENDAINSETKTDIFKDESSKTLSLLMDNCLTECKQDPTDVHDSSSITTESITDTQSHSNQQEIMQDNHETSVYSKESQEKVKRQNRKSNKCKKTCTEKTTRVRTVLNEKQLQMLRLCYSTNPRPDAIVKEQLVEMTGLTPRVIRVWFQNKRCKEKKQFLLMKHLQDSDSKQSKFKDDSTTSLKRTHPEKSLTRNSRNTIYNETIEISPQDRHNQHLGSSSSKYPFAEIRLEYPVEYAQSGEFNFASIHPTNKYGLYSNTQEYISPMYKPNYPYSTSYEEPNYDYSQDGSVYIPSNQKNLPYTRKN